MKKFVITTLLVTSLLLGTAVVDPFEATTVKAISSISSPYSYNSKDFPTIGIGYITSGDYVKRLQRFLNVANSECYAAGIAGNFNCGTVDGIFGNNTWNAVCNFQLDFGLDVDGICGPATWKQLIKIRNKYD